MQTKLSFLGAMTVGLLAACGGVEQVPGDAGAGGSGGAPVNKAPWPMYQGGPGHLGRASVNGPKGATLKWSFDIGGGGFLRSAAVAEDGTVYVTSGEGLFAFAPDGSKKWSLAGVRGDAPAIGADGTIYTWSGAVSPSGSLLWKLPFAAAQSGPPTYGASPTIGPNGTVYFQSCKGLHAVKANGALAWEALGMPCAGSQAIPAVAADGTAYIAGYDGMKEHLYAVSPKGKPLWDASLSTECSTPVVSPEGDVYIACLETGLRAFSPGGAVKWTVQTDFLTLAPALAADGTIYAPTNHSLRAYRADGSFLWEVEISSLGPPVGSPLVGADGTVYLLGNNTVGAVTSAGIAWYFLPPNGDLFQPAALALGPDGTLYFPSWAAPTDKGWFYALAP